MSEPHLNLENEPGVKFEREMREEFSRRDKEIRDLRRILDAVVHMCDMYPRGGGDDVRQLAFLVQGEIAAMLRKIR